MSLKRPASSASDALESPTKRVKLSYNLPTENILVCINSDCWSVILRFLNFWDLVNIKRTCKTLQGYVMYHCGATNLPLTMNALDSISRASPGSYIYDSAPLTIKNMVRGNADKYLTSLLKPVRMSNVKSAPNCHDDAAMSTFICSLISSKANPMVSLKLACAMLKSPMTCPCRLFIPCYYECVLRPDIDNQMLIVSDSPVFTRIDQIFHAAAKHGSSLRFNLCYNLICRQKDASGGPSTFRRLLDGRNIYYLSRLLVQHFVRRGHYGSILKSYQILTTDNWTFFALLWEQYSFQRHDHVYNVGMWKLLGGLCDCLSSNLGVVKENLRNPTIVLKMIRFIIMEAQNQLNGRFIDWEPLVSLLDVASWKCLVKDLLYICPDRHEVIQRVLLLHPESRVLNVNDLDHIVKFVFDSYAYETEVGQFWKSAGATLVIDSTFRNIASHELCKMSFYKFMKVITESTANIRPRFGREYCLSFVPLDTDLFQTKKTTWRKIIRLFLINNVPLDVWHHYDHLFSKKSILEGLKTNCPLDAEVVRYITDKVGPWPVEPMNIGNHFQTIFDNSFLLDQLIIALPNYDQLRFLGKNLKTHFRDIVQDSTIFPARDAALRACVIYSSDAELIISLRILVESTANVTTDVLIFVMKCAQSKYEDRGNQFNNIFMSVVDRCICEDKSKKGRMTLKLDMILQTFPGASGTCRDKIFTKCRVLLTTLRKRPSVSATVKTNANQICMLLAERLYCLS